jgi:hypothetical protein
LAAAIKLMQEAGYANGIDPITGESLVLYLDTAARDIFFIINSNSNCLT